jgi:hypothetical protein
MGLQGILYGLGLPGFQSLGTLNEFWDVEPVEFAINVASQDITAKKQVKGVSTVSGSANTENIYTANIKIEAISWTALQFAMGIQSAISTNLILPDVKVAKISALGEIADTDIKVVVTPAFTSVGKVWVVDPNAETAFTPITTGSPAAGQFRVDAANNKLIFNTADAGKVVKYRQLTQKDTITGIGFEQTAARFKSINFSGLVYGNDGEHSRIHIPNMTLIKKSGLSLSGQASSLELEYRLNEQPGYDLPFQLEYLAA